MSESPPPPPPDPQPSRRRRWLAALLGLSAGIWLLAQGPGRLRREVETRALARISALVSGEVTVDSIRALGTLEQELEVRGLEVTDRGRRVFRVDRAEVSLRLETGGARLRGVRLRGVEAVLSHEGSGWNWERLHRASASAGTGTGATPALTATGLHLRVEHPELGGVLELSDGSLSHRDGTTSLAGSADHPLLRRHGAAPLEIALERRGERWSWSPARRELGVGGLLSISPGVWSPGEVLARLDVRELPFSVALPLLREDLDGEGSVDSTFRVTGTPESLHLELRASSSGGSLHTTFAGTQVFTGAELSARRSPGATASAELVVGSLDLRHGERRLDVEDLRARGQVFRDPQGQMRGSLRNLSARVLGGASLDLGGRGDEQGQGIGFALRDLEVSRLAPLLGQTMLLATGVIELGGVLRRRTGGDSSGELWARSERLVVRPEADWSPPPVEIRDLRGKLEFEPRPEGTLVELKSLEGRSLGGSLTVTGTNLRGPSPASRLRFQLEGGRAEAVSELLAREDLRLAGPLGAELLFEAGSSGWSLTGDLEAGASEITVTVGPIPLTVHPERLAGRLRITPDEVDVGPLTGELAGGAARFRYSIDHEREASPWNMRFEGEGADASVLASRYLTQAHELSGSLDWELLLAGQDDRTRLSGKGRVDARGRVGKLERLDELGRRYGLRNLRNVEVRRFSAEILAAGGEVHAQPVRLESSIGDASGDVWIDLAKAELDGGLGFSLHRRVLGEGHRLATMLEGGSFFDFRVEFGGPLSDPRASFRSPRLLKGAAMTGAMLFSPVGAPLAIFTGLKNLFRRRRRRTAREAAPATPPTTATTSP